MDAQSMTWHVGDIGRTEEGYLVLVTWVDEGTVAYEHLDGPPKGAVGIAKEDSLERLPTQTQLPS